MTGTDALLAALARRNRRPQTHPHPELVPTPRRWCVACRAHLASEPGALQPSDLCVCCEEGAS